MGSSSTSTDQTISLPHGGGALQGIGETFAPDLHTGTGNFTIPITLPSGRNGFQPQLALTYSSGSGNGPFGLGWSLGVPVVTRKTSRGVPRYRDRSDLAQRDTFILAGSEDLVPVAGATAPLRHYRPRSEGLFARIAHDETADVWEVHTKDGLVSRYGLAQADDVRAVVADPARPERIFAWYLSETVDPFGNRIVYEYRRDRGASRRFDQLYLARIRYADYGADRFLVSVSFEYEERPDAFSDCRAGFEIRTRHRCKRIAIRTDAERERLVRSYDLTYADDAAGRARNGASLLSRITVTGHDDERPDGTESMPPVEFRYTAFRPESRKFFPLRGDDLPARSLAAGIELVDLFGRGLPDFLEMNGTVRYWRNRGNGTFDRPREMAAAPGLRLGDPGVELLDADGNGRADLMVTTGPMSGYYPLSFEGRFDARSFRRFARAPSFDLKDPRCRLVDLDGDGVTDAIRAGTRLECFFHRPDEGWNETRVVDRSAVPGLQGIDFSDPRLRWADMNGDGLQDIVLVHNGRVEYWPCLGYGEWGEPVRMTGSPRFPDAAIYGSAGYDPKRLLIGDLDGDGAADLVYVGNGEVTLWINQSGNGWSDPIVIRGTPRVTDIDSLRLVDLLGNGVAGLLWSTDKTPGRDNLRFLDFTGGIKPYLLDQLDNNTGAVTRVHYQPSTFFYLADERARKRWKTPLPFPVQVVARTEAVDQISDGRLTTEYSYHHGFWDGVEREFRGFGRVDHRDTEVFDQQGSGAFSAAAVAHAPPLETRTWFHQGAIGDTNDWTYAGRAGEFWSGDPTLLPATEDPLAGLTGPARRDALRALRGRILRTELYALDGTPRESLPVTVAEHQYGLRELPADAPGKRIFFVFSIGERTTQWERGDEPMHRFAFTADHDAFGQPRNTIAIAVPRGRDPRAALESWPEPYLVTQSITAYAAASEAPYMADRVAHVTSYEIAGERTRSVPQLREALLAGALTRTVIGQTLSFYDGAAFEGLPLGTIGARGAPMRNETLVLTPEVLAAAYPDGLPPFFVDGNANWSEYPDALRSMLAPSAGYLRRTASAGTPFVTGLYVTTRREYDFQRQNDSARGLVRTTRDPLGRNTVVTYDAFALLPVTVVDPAGLQTSAVYDYRALRPREVTDPNGNRSLFAYRPLGLLESVAAIGKPVPGHPDEPLGDTAAAPGIRYLYDFSAFARRGQPVSVRTIRRVHHVTDTRVPPDQRDATIETTEYSDGFGRLLQARVQGSDVQFGDASFGGGVLPADPQDVVGTRADVAPRPAGTAPNVVVSGAQVYDNKGRVVEQYQPYFDTGWDFSPPAANQFGQKVALYYDALGRAVRTVNPDGSELTVVHGRLADLAAPGNFAPSPWEAHSYGLNDNAGRTPAADPGAPAYDHHWNTPSTVVVDALGRAVVTIARNRARRPNAGDPLPPVEALRSTTTYDIRGNALAVTEPLGRTVARSVYDFANRVLRSESLDAGLARRVIDAAGNVVESRDAKGALALRACDTLNRPALAWARDAAGLPLTLRERLVYGDAAGLADAAARNLRGRLWRHYDEAGLLAVDYYDFNGRVLEKSRRTVRDAILLALIAAQAGPGGPPPIDTSTMSLAVSEPPPRRLGAAQPAVAARIIGPAPSPTPRWRATPFRMDWQPPAVMTLDAYTETLLDAAEQTSSQYDALGRLWRLLYPADANGVRRVLQPGYDRAGRLERVRLDDTTYVERVAHDARGQRTLIVYGNGVISRYAYDPRRSRLVRLRSERCTRPAANVYRPSDADHPLQDLCYAQDLDGNILTLTDRTPGCGVLNNPDALGGVDAQLAARLAAGDALIRRFGYDPLGRLESATGRTCSAIPLPRPWDEAPPCGYGSGAHGTPGQDNAPALTALYRESYAYDAAGNLLRLRRERGGSATVRHCGVGGRTPAAWDAEWRQHAAGDPWPNAPDNRLTNVGDDNTAATQTHQFDPAGNLTRQNTDRHFLWDAANRLKLFCVQVIDPLQTPGAIIGAEPSIAAHYLYDAAGQRVKKLTRTQGGGWEATIYIDGAFERRRWAAAGATPSTATVHHLMDDKRRIALLRTGSPHPQEQGPPVQYHLGDHLDSSVVVTDGAGAWVNREEFSPYGEATFGGFARKRYRFTGKERDAESGLNYHGARYYAPWLARWVSCDPLFMDYGYCRCSPLRLVDPDGLAGKESGHTPEVESNAGPQPPEQTLKLERGPYKDVAGHHSQMSSAFLDKNGKDPFKNNVTTTSQTKGAFTEARHKGASNVQNRIDGRIWGREAGAAEAGVTNPATGRPTVTIEQLAGPQATTNLDPAIKPTPEGTLRPGPSPDREMLKSFYAWRGAGAPPGQSLTLTLQDVAERADLAAKQGKSPLPTRAPGGSMKVSPAQRTAPSSAGFVTPEGLFLMGTTVLTAWAIWDHSEKAAATTEEKGLAMGMAQFAKENAKFYSAAVWGAAGGALLLTLCTGGMAAPLAIAIAASVTTMGTYSTNSLIDMATPDLK